MVWPGLTEQLPRARAAAYKQTHARILMLSDENQDDGPMKDEEIAGALKVGTATVERVRRRCVEEGVEAALGRRAAPPAPPSEEAPMAKVRPSLIVHRGHIPAAGWDWVRMDSCKCWPTDQVERDFIASTADSAPRVAVRPDL